MHTKYELSTFNGSKVIANVKVDNRQTNKQTEQKQYAPDHSIQGHKNSSKKKNVGDRQMDGQTDSSLSLYLHWKPYNEQ